MHSRVLNALVQHAMYMRVLLQIYRGMYECAPLTVNLHVSCTVCTCKRMSYLRVCTYVASKATYVATYV